MRFHRQRRRPMAAVRVTVQAITIRDGRVVLTCIHPRTGQIYNNVALLEQGGGDTMAIHFPVSAPTDPTRPSVVPESSGASQGWVVFDREGAPAFSAAVPRSRKRWLVGSTPRPSESEPHPRTYSPGDFCIMNGQGDVLGHIIVDRNGCVTIATDAELRLQVQSGKKVRIFSEDNSDEPVVVYSTTRAVLNDIIDRVNANTEQLRLVTPVAVSAYDALATEYDGLAATAALIPDPVSVQLNRTLAEEQRAIMVQLESWQESTQLNLVEVGTEIASGTLMVPEGA